MRARLIPPNVPTLPKVASGPMLNGDAQDPAVDRIALTAARDIDGFLDEPTHVRPTQRITQIQLVIIRAINEALDRCQALGGRRVR